MTLPTHGREVTADATKGGRSSLTVKRARNLLLDFDHAQIALGLVVTSNFLFWFHDRVIVIAQIGQDALLAAGTIVDTDTLSMPQKSLVEIIDSLRVIGK
jgi:hypothetical protein